MSEPTPAQASPAPVFRHQGPGHGLVALEILEQLGWRQTPGDDWRLLWDTGVPLLPFFQSLQGRLYNHLPGMEALGHKSGLQRTLAAARERLRPRGLDGLYRFHPQTFLLPEEHAAFQEAAAREPEAVWIKKPQRSSRGRGIALVPDPRALRPEPDTLVQRYLAEPHLIDGHKYTLRCYLLVTSVDPLCAFLFDEGFCKFTSRPFSLAVEHRGDVFRHLTNPDVLRNDATMPVSSRNLTHSGFRARLAADGVDGEALFARIRRMVALAVLAAREPLRAAARKSGVLQGCFDLLGIDVALDRRLTPWLIECNLSPSLSVEAAEDTQASREEGAVKRGLIRDAIAVLGLGGSGPVCGLGASAVRAQLERARATGLRPLFPAEDALELLPLLERSGPAELRLALAAAPGAARRLRPHRAQAFALDDALVVQSAARPWPLLLDGVEPFVWTALEQGVAIDEAVAELQPSLPRDSAPADERVLAAAALLLTEGLVAPGPGGGGDPAAATASTPPATLAPAPAPAHGWNAAVEVLVDGLRAEVRLSPAAASLVEPTLAHLRASGAGADAGRARLDVERAGSGFRLRDEAGADERVRPELLAARVHQHLRRRAARARRSLGPFAALLLDGRRPALLLSTPADWLGPLEGTFSVLSRQPLLLAGAPLRALADRAPGAAPVPLTALLVARRDLDGEPRCARAHRRAALDLLYASALDEPPELDLAAAGSLLGWLRGAPCLELRAADARGLADLLRPLLR